MRWIGQHIIDLSTQFRGQVTFKNVLSSGELKVLVLDSDGTLGYNSAIGGDITNFEMISDSGDGAKYNVESGAVSIGLTGSEGVNVTNSGEMFSVTAVAGEIDHDSLNNFLAAEHIDWAGGSAGTIHSTNIPTLNQNTSGTAGGLSSTLAIGSGGTGATNSNGWLNSRITTSADGSLNYDATAAVDVNHDRLAGFVAAEHVNWAGASAGTIHSTNIPTLNQNTSGTAATVTGAAQTAITSVGTLTALQVDNVNINGSTIAVDTDTFIIESTGDLLLKATGNDITADTDHFLIESAATADPTLTLKSTTNSNVGSTLEFISDKGGAGADNDVIGSIKFIGDDTAEVQTQFARIVGSVSESADTDEAGKLEFFVAESNGTATNPNTVGLLIEGEHATDGQIDVTVAAGAASTTTIAGTLTMGSTAALDNSGNLLTNAATATNLVASTSTAVQLGTIELGHANDTTIARSAANVVTIEGREIVTRSRVIHLEQGTFSDAIATTEHFFPSVTTSESTSFTNVVTPLLMPVDGKLLKIHLKTNQNQNGSDNTITFKMYNLDDGENWNDSNKSLLATKVIDGTVKATVMVADFTDLTTTGSSGTNDFNEGDILGISLTNSHDQSHTAKYVWTFVFEMDYNSY